MEVTSAIMRGSLAGGIIFLIFLLHILFSVTPHRKNTLYRNMIFDVIKFYTLCLTVLTFLIIIYT